MSDRDRQRARGTRPPSCRCRGGTRALASRGTRRTSLALLLGLLLGAAAHAGARADEGRPGFRVVVHPSNAQSIASRDLLSDVFLKKVSRWPDGEQIRPVDLTLGSDVRETFSRTILRRSAAAVRNYWQQRIFAGRGVPPPEVTSDDAVIRYVQQHAGAIGYVSASTEPAAVKVLHVR